MEITSFILGVAAVITILMVVVTFMNFMEIKNLQKQINILKDTDEAIIRGNNALENRSINYTDQLNNNIQRELENLYRHIDSRVDKLESKVYKDFDLIRTQSKSY
jgi:predicted PurR-regulated permease PerM